jgi:hypothetical protein
MTSEARVGLAGISLACGLFACAPRTTDACIERARAALGGDTRVAIVASTFVFVDARGFGWNEATFPQDVDFAERALTAMLNGRFSRLPERPVTVYLFPSAFPYDDFCAAQWGGPCETPFGFYSDHDRAIVVDVGRGDGTITHELAHTLVEADFPDAPTWLNEGVASLFEAPVLPAPGDIHGVRNWRHAALADGLRAGTNDLSRMERLFGMGDAEFRDRNMGMRYAVARELCLWLDESDRLWPFYRRFRDGLSDDPTGERAFLAVLGTTPSAAEAAWEAWVLRDP